MERSKWPGDNNQDWTCVWKKKTQLLSQSITTIVPSCADFWWSVMCCISVSFSDCYHTVCIQISRKECNSVLLLFALRHGHWLSLWRRRPTGTGSHLQWSCWRTDGHSHSDSIWPMGFQLLPSQFWLCSARQQRSGSKWLPRYYREQPTTTVSALTFMYDAFTELSPLADLVVGAFGVDKAVLYRYVSTLTSAIITHE